MNTIRRMIALAILISFLFSCSSSSTGVPSKSNNYWVEIITDLNDFTYSGRVYFLNDKRGIIVTRRGKIGLTVDGGYSWQLRESHTNQPLRAIYFVNDKIGFAVGGAYQDGVLLKTEDAGDSWVRLQAPMQGELKSVYFSNTRRGWIVGVGDGGIWHTSDGGQTWVDQYPYQGTLSYVYFIDDDIGFVCGKKDTILKTKNGGQEWRTIAVSGTVPYVQRIFFRGRLGIASAGHTILQSYDLGETWTQIHELLGNVSDCIMLDKNTILAVGGGEAYHYLQYGAIHVSFDGGKNWITDDLTHAVSDLHRVNSNQVIGVGRSLIKFHFK